MKHPVGILKVPGMPASEIEALLAKEEWACAGAAVTWDGEDAYMVVMHDADSDNAFGDVLAMRDDIHDTYRNVQHLYLDEDRGVWCWQNGGGDCIGQLVSLPDHQSSRTYQNVLEHDNRRYYVRPNTWGL